MAKHELELLLNTEGEQIPQFDVYRTPLILRSRVETTKQ